MAIIVQKYGGSSLSDIDKLQTVAERIVQRKRAGDDVVVVVSAMGKSTENLLELARHAAQAANVTTERHVEPPRRELDMLLSTGERVSMALVSIAVQARGCDAVSFTGSQSGIITNDRHFDARIIEVRPHRIEDELARGRVVIVAGYQGMSYRREVTTLGRGGSDTTAVALAAALGARDCEIYSDVDGVYSADPNRVPDARHVPELDYDTMQHMAERGAKVLNAQAVEWAKRHKVVIRARRTGDSPERGARETRVSDGASGVARAVVAERRLAWLRCAPEHELELWRVLAELSLPVRQASVGHAGTSLVVPLLNVPDWRELRARLVERVPAVALDDSTFGAVSLIGVGVGNDATLVRDARLSAGERALAHWVEPMAQTCLVREAELGEVERRWHRHFVETQPDTSAKPARDMS